MVNYDKSFALIKSSHKRFAYYFSNSLFTPFSEHPHYVTRNIFFVWIFMGFTDFELQLIWIFLNFDFGKNANFAAYHRIDSINFDLVSE